MGPGAQPGEVNVLGAQTRRLQLIRVRLPEIDVPTTARSWLEPLLHVALSVVGAAERIHDFVPDLTAAHTQTRPDGGHEILGPAAEIGFETSDGVPRDRRDGAAPAGVYRRHDRLTSVCDKYWGAISDANGNRHIRIVCDDRVGGWTRPWIRCAPADQRHFGTVYLVDQQQPIGFDPHP
jgi:hypothetical protein